MDSTHRELGHFIAFKNVVSETPARRWYSYMYNTILVFCAVCSRLIRIMVAVTVASIERSRRRRIRFHRRRDTRINILFWLQFDIRDMTACFGSGFNDHHVLSGYLDLSFHSNNSTSCISCVLDIFDRVIVYCYVVLEQDVRQAALNIYEKSLSASMVNGLYCSSFVIYCVARNMTKRIVYYTMHPVWSSLTTGGKYTPVLICTNTVPYASWYYDTHVVLYEYGILY